MKLKSLVLAILLIVCCLLTVSCGNGDNADLPNDTSTDVLDTTTESNEEPTEPGTEVCPCTSTRTARENEIDSTCKTEGSYDEVVYCVACDKELSRTSKTIEKKTTHTAATAVEENRVEATCKEAGSYDEVVYCSVCDKELSRTSKTIEKKTTHTAATAVEENRVESTCKEAGSYDEVVYCSVCDKELSRTSKTIEKKTTHTAATAVEENRVEATCKEAGSYDEVVYCSVCDKELSRTEKTIPVKTEHTAAAAVEENRVESTCKEEGSYDEVVYCSVCDKELSRTEKTIPVKTEHTAGAAVEENRVESTCKEAGSYDEVVCCSVCDKELSRTEKTIPVKTEHTAAAAVEENCVESTCKEEGSYDEVVYCSVCDKELSRTEKTIPVKTEHTAGAAVEENRVEATCKEEGSYDEVVYCSVCDKELSRTSKTIEKEDHVYESVVTAPTCTAKGYTTYTCDCGDSYVADYVAATGHSFSTAWEQNDTHHWHKAICGHTSEISDKGEHAFGNDLICDTCQFEKEEDKISFKTLQANGTDVYGKVANTTTTFSFLTEVTKSGKATFDVFRDLECSDIIRSKTASLEVGDNTFYILEYVDGEVNALYTVTVRRKPMYTVTFDAKGGTSVESQTVEEDALATLPETTKTGYTFAGWSYDFVTPITKDTAITASWTANEYTITYDVNGGDALENNTQTATYDSDYTLAVPTRTGYTFAGWYHGETPFENGTWTLTDGITLTAKWNVITYHISYNLDGGNAENEVTYTVEDEITLTNPTCTGYTFVGWTFEGQSEPILSVTIAKGTIGDKSYTAHWTVNVITEVNIDAAGMSSGDGSFEKGASTTVTATTNEGYTFIGWYDGNTQLSTNESYTFTIDTPITLTAKWNVNVSTDKNIDVAGSVSGAGDYAQGTSATVTATTNAGYTFAGWYVGGECLSTNPTYTFTVDTPITLTAKWTVNISTSVNIETAGTSTGDGTFEYGSNVTVTATTKPGYIFNGWYDGDKLLSTNLNYTFNVTVPVSLEANWKINPLLDDFYFLLTDTTLTITEVKDKTKTSYKLPEDTTHIAASAFSGCINLTNIVIPRNVESIGENAFYGCSALTGVIANDIDAWFAISFGNDYAHPNYYGTLHIIDENGENATTLVIPEGTTQIGACTFKNCTTLTTIIIPASVTNIGEDAFYGCTDLTSVTIRDLDAWFAISFGNDYSHPNYYGTLRVIDYQGNEVTTLVIPEGTTQISAYMFQNYSTLTTLTIPATVTSIGTSAFDGCTNITTITMPTTAIEHIYNANFVTVVLNGGTSINSNAFKDCSRLERITIPSSITGIGIFVFENCNSLRDVYITDLTAWCNISFEYYASNPLHVAQNLYLNGELITNLVIPNDVTEIGSYAFYGCGQLESITIPNNVTNIGSFAFSNCVGVKNVIISNSVVIIGNHAFYGCNNLESITVPFVGSTKDGITNTHFGYLFGATSEIDHDKYVPASLKTVIVTGGSIYDYAFYNCSNLTSITVPNNIKSIGIHSFSGCRSLTEFIIPESVSSIGMSAFLYCESLTDITVPSGVTNIGESAFEGCHSLAGITIPDGVTSIDSHTFNGCSNLMHVTFGVNSQLTSIGDFAFYNCGELTSTTIPENVTSIGYSAFEGCSSLAGITIPDSVTSIVSRVFEGCTNLIQKENGISYVDKWAIDCDANVTMATLRTDTVGIGDSAFHECMSLVNVELPNSVMYIGNRAFYSCTNLSSILIPKNVKSIGDEAFYNCSNIKSITVADDNPVYHSQQSCLIQTTDKVLVLGCQNSTIPTDGSVTRIGNDAFAYCSGMTYLRIPDGIISIGEHAFYGYSQLQEVTIPDSVQNIERGAFSNCKNLTRITIGKGVTNIEAGAFTDNFSLSHIMVAEENSVYHSWQNCLIETQTNTLIAGCKTSLIPTDGSVTSIGSAAFSGCFDMDHIIIPICVTSIGTEAFISCFNLSEIYYGGTPIDWNNVIISSDNNNDLFSAAIYYYSEIRPTDTTYNYWYYDENGVPTKW